MNLITKDELIENYEWKVIKRVLKSELPWIIDIDVDAENLDKYNSILIDIIIDPFEFSKEYNVPIFKRILKDIILGKEISYYDFKLIFNVDDEFDSEMSKKLLTLLSTIKNTKSLPEELRFSNKRGIHFNQIIIKPNENFIEEAKNLTYG